MIKLRAKLHVFLLCRYLYSSSDYSYIAKSLFMILSQLVLILVSAYIEEEYCSNYVTSWLCENPPFCVLYTGSQ